MLAEILQKTVIFLRQKVYRYKYIKRLVRNVVLTSPELRIQLFYWTLTAQQRDLEIEIWPGIVKELTNYVKSYWPCMFIKPCDQKLSGPMIQRVLTRVINHVAMDLVVPLSMTYGRHEYDSLWPTVVHPQHWASLLCNVTSWTSFSFLGFLMLAEILQKDGHLFTAESMSLQINKTTGEKRDHNVSKTESSVI
jgi:hypothetical protein